MDAVRYHVEYRLSDGEWRGEWRRWTRTPFKDHSEALKRADWCRSNLTHMAAEWRVTATTPTPTAPEQTADDYANRPDYVPTIQQINEWAGGKWGRQISCIGFERAADHRARFAVIQVDDSGEAWRYTVEGMQTSTGAQVWHAATTAMEACKKVAELLNQRRSLGETP